MKNAVFVGMLLACAAGLSQAQELHKGNLVGVHVMTIKLQPGVSMEQFTAFYMSKVMPAYEKSRPGWKAYPARRIRGEKAEGFGCSS